MLKDKELDNIIKENEWVVNDVISKYQHLVDRDELYAVGLMGLYEGIKKYDNTKNTKLSTYARHWVKARGPTQNVLREQTYKGFCTQTLTRDFALKHLQGILY